MDIPNAFIGAKDPPAQEAVLAVLGPSAQAWSQLIDWFAQEQSVTEQEWKSSSPKYGWSLILKLKKRTIVYLGPCSGCFRVSFILGDRAVAAARQSNLSKPALKLIEEATRYAEGTGLRLIVKSPADLASIRKLAAIKLAN